jgi:hypothetical protein
VLIGAARSHGEFDTPHAGAHARFAYHTIASFFSAPILPDRPELKLVVDNAPH